MTHRRPSPLLLLMIVLALGTVIRLWLATRIPLSGDELYYWQWSLKPSLTYPDHPPMVAWIIWATTHLIGQSPIGIRLGAILMADLLALVIYGLGKSAGLPPLKSVAAATLSTWLPACSAGALIMTPDVGLGLFYTAATWCLVVGRANPKRRTFLLFGLLVGLGLFTKLSALLLVFLLLGTAYNSRKGTQPIPNSLVAGTIAVAALTILPWLVATWPSGSLAIVHQQAHLAGRLAGPQTPIWMFPVRVLELLLGQLLIATPALGLLIGQRFWRHRHGNSGPHIVNKSMVVEMAVVLPLLATAISALTTHPEQNWASLGHPLLPIIAFLIWQKKQNRSKWLGPKPVMATAALFTVAIHFHAAFGVPVPPARDPLNRLRGWNFPVAIINKMSTVDCVVADNYGVAAQLAWRTRQNPLPCISSTDRPFAQPQGANWIIVDEQKDWGEQRPQVACTKQLPHHLWHQTYNGRVIRTIEYWEAHHCTVKPVVSGTVVPTKGRTDAPGSNSAPQSIP